MDETAVLILIAYLCGYFAHKISDFFFGDKSYISQSSGQKYEELKIRALIGEFTSKVIKYEEYIKHEKMGTPVYDYMVGKRDAYKSCLSLLVEQLE